MSIYTQIGSVCIGIPHLACTSNCLSLCVPFAQTFRICCFCLFYEALSAKIFKPYKPRFSCQFFKYLPMVAVNAARGCEKNQKFRTLYLFLPKYMDWRRKGFGYGVGHWVRVVINKGRNLWISFGDGFEMRQYTLCRAFSVTYAWAHFLRTMAVLMLTLLGWSVLASFEQYIPFQD